MVTSIDKTVLVVEDEPDVRYFLQMVLEDAGFRVLTAEDGEKAWEMIGTAKPDFITLDLILPRRSGRRLLRDLKADPVLAKIPVLLVTAHAKDGLGSEGPEDVLNNFILEGPGRLLEKPVKPADLVRCVSETLGVSVPEANEEKLGLRREAQRLVANADPETLRRALDALRH
ncbi:MAG: response regulator [Acidobacteria bacterium]|nr:response regulator [Acidobacteriota bacterium]